MILTLLILSILASFIYSYLTKGAAKKIRRNGWQMKLIRWTINFEPAFKGYCPLFWTTWICIFLAPITIAIHSAGWVINIFKECIKDDSPKVEKAHPPDDWIKERMMTDDFYKSRYEIWIAENPNWKEEFLSDKIKRGSLAEAYKLKTERKEKRKERISAAMVPALNFAKYLIVPSIIFIAAFVAYCIYKFAIEVAASALSIGIWPLIKAIIIVFSIASVGLFIYYLYGKVKKMATLTKKVEKLVGHEEKKSNTSDFSDVIGKIFDFVCVPFVFLGKLYKKECPIIEWDDEPSKDR
jgi:hypothetical protein